MSDRVIPLEWSAPHDRDGARQVTSPYCSCRVRIWPTDPASVATARLCPHHKFSDLDAALSILMLDSPPMEPKVRPYDD